MDNFDETKSDTSNNSFYIENVPLNLRGRSEWWELKHNEIKITKEIGKGTCGIVYKIKWRGLDCVSKCLINKENETDYNDLLNEISIISHLRHPNLVLFLGACTIKEPLMLLYEYIELGTIENYFNNMAKKNNKTVWKPKNNVKKKWLIELSQAVYFLHSCYYPIMHRDLKPSNILLTNNLDIKITDFGLSKILKNNSSYKMSGCTGTLRYMAPEILKDNNYNYDLKIDVYSLSLNFWYIFTGKIPFSEIKELQNINRLIIFGYRPNLCEIKNTEICKLLDKMWNVIPENRPNMSEVLNIVTNIDYNIKNNKCIKFRNIFN
tara:strand:+ start:11 stop:973 length:963 start_codon:yes stop_codon:yes gene_type:complete